MTPHYGLCPGLARLDYYPRPPKPAQLRSWPYPSLLWLGLLEPAYLWRTERRALIIHCWPACTFSPEDLSPGLWTFNSRTVYCPRWFYCVVPIRGIFTAVTIFRGFLSALLTAHFLFQSILAIRCTRLRKHIDDDCYCLRYSWRVRPPTLAQ